MAANRGALEAFFAEVGEAAGDPRLDPYVSGLRADLAEITDLEARARDLVERMALALQGSLLLRFSDPAVAEAFCSSRLGGNGEGPSARCQPAPTSSGSSSATAQRPRPTTRFPCDPLKSRNDVGDVAGGSAWHPVVGSVLRSPDPLARARGLGLVPLSAAPLPPVAVLGEVRIALAPACLFTDAAALLAAIKWPSHDSTSFILAVLWLAALFSLTAYFALRTPDDGGDDGGVDEDLPDPPWWPDFERDLRDYMRRGPKPRPSRHAWPTGAK